MGMLLQSFTSFFTAFIIGFAKGWKLTLVILAVSPALGISAGLFSKVGHTHLHTPPAHSLTGKYTLTKHHLSVAFTCCVCVCRC